VAAATHNIDRDKRMGFRVSYREGETRMGVGVGEESAMASTAIPEASRAYPEPIHMEA
jgi:hypothetical protein